MATATRTPGVRVTAVRRSDRDGGRRLALLSLLAGLTLTVIWSYAFVDAVIGDNVANALLGYDAKETAITGSAMGAVFAFVSGIAGTFTACNVAVFSTMCPLLERSDLRQSRLATLRPLGWLTLGLVSVAGMYGAIGAAVGEGIPQLSGEMIGRYPMRLLQSTVVFGVVGVALVWLGLSSLRMVRNPLAGLFARHPAAPLVVMGAIVGMFLIGRPFPLFFKMFEYAASTNDAAFGALVFVLQALGNVALLVLLFILLTYGTRGRLQRWLAASPGRIDRFAGAGLIAAGSFTFLYWVVRVPAAFDYGWWPTVPWA